MKTVNVTLTLSTGFKCSIFSVYLSGKLKIVEWIRWSYFPQKERKKNRRYPTHQSRHFHSISANIQASLKVCKRKTRCTSLFEWQHSSCNSWSPSGNTPSRSQPARLLLDVSHSTILAHEFRSNVLEHKPLAFAHQLHLQTCTIWELQGPSGHT